jgi:ribonuclease P protein component
MLPKERRIKKQLEFDFVFAAAKKTRGQYFNLFWRATENDEPAKFAVITSKKVGKAHSRNHIRRQIFHIIRAHAIYNSTNVLVIFSMLSEATNLSFEELEAQMNVALDNILQNLSK